MTTRTFEWESSRQLSIVGLLLAFILPSAFAFFAFRVVLRLWVENDGAPIIAYLVVAAVALLVLTVLGVVLLRSEARQLGISFWARACFKKLSRREWLLYLGILLVGGLATVSLSGVLPAFMDALGLSVPDYYPFFLDPTIDAANTDMAVLSPGFDLRGAWGVLPLMAVVLTFNILAEELYFRAWVLPKLSKYGNWGWIANGTLFALYHTFQLWFLPILLPASLLIAFVVYRSKSVLPAFAFHFVGNFLLTMAGVVVLVAS